MQDAAEFVFDEAELLDAADWDAWLALFLPDGRYWVPCTPEQTDPWDSISHVWEDIPLMRARIGRLRHRFALGLPIRTSHVVGGVRVLPGAADGVLRVRSRFTMQEFVDGETRLHGGRVLHDLVAADGVWRIRLKRVDLVDADGVQELLQVFL